MDQTSLLKLVDILQEIEGMEDISLRSSLVSIGFNRREISPLQQQRSDIERVDLMNIVKHVTALGKLGILIDNAIGFTQKREVMEALTELKTEYLILKGISKQTAVVPKASKADSYQIPNNSTMEFDVFLAHNSKDKPQVIAIAEELERRGIKIWLDKEHIVPGQWFLDAIQHALSRVKCVIVFFGLHGVGDWQIAEIRVALNQYIKGNLRVIPVLLPGVDEVPENLLFLRELNWIQFKSQPDEAEALDSLEKAIRSNQPPSQL